MEGVLKDITDRALGPVPQLISQPPSMTATQHIVYGHQRITRKKYFPQHEHLDSGI